jgi:hypothetical protein
VICFVALLRYRVPRLRLKAKASPISLERALKIARRVQYTSRFPLTTRCASLAWRPYLRRLRLTKASVVTNCRTDCRGDQSSVTEVAGGGSPGMRDCKTIGCDAVLS